MGKCVCFIVMNMAEGMALSLLIKGVEGWNETVMRGMMSTQEGSLTSVCQREGPKNIKRQSLMDKKK